MILIQRPLGLRQKRRRMRDFTSELKVALTRRETGGSSDFDLNPDYRPAMGRRLRPASVLVPISMAGPEPTLILTKRSSRLKHHPGQIAFPGGKVDDGDRDIVDTALREAEEEIGLRRELPRILGALPEHETVTGFTVTPVVAVLNEGFKAVPEPGEVEEVFEVPLSHVLAPENYIVESRLWRNMRRHYYTVPYGPYYIWGATARMLRVLAARLSE